MPPALLYVMRMNNEPSSAWVSRRRPDSGDSDDVVRKQVLYYVWRKDLDLEGIDHSTVGSAKPAEISIINGNPNPGR